MRCTSCQRPIAAGAEAQKMIIEYAQTDGSLKLFGFGMPDGVISAAKGAMVRGWHSKCFWVAKKREAKGDAVTGRVVPSGITGYTVDTAVFDESQVHLHARIGRLRLLAESMGKGVGDPQVTEAFNAQERGGVYPHTHRYRLETYQLIAHLEYAHGITDQNLFASNGGLAEKHIELHAQQALEVTRASREADEEADPASRDWRPQFTAEIE